MKFPVKKQNIGTSLAVQCLRLHAPNAGGMGSIPDWGTKILHATRCGQKIKINQQQQQKKETEYRKLHNMIRSCIFPRTYDGNQGSFPSYSCRLPPKHLSGPPRTLVPQSYLCYLGHDGLLSQRHPQICDLNNIRCYSSQGKVWMVGQG